MDCPRDLGQLDLWRESLERSLARRGRPKRSSVELYRLRGERDLLLDDVVLESARYSQLRRRAAADHLLVPRPAAAVGGISALTLLAVTTFPGLLGGRSGTKQRVVYAAKLRGRGFAAKGTAIASSRPRSVAHRTLAGASALVAFDHPAAPKVSSVSESVRKLQRRLGVVADGDFGPITLRAVKAFQVSHGLVVDGIVGPVTRAALGLPAGPILRANRKYFHVHLLKREGIRELQRRLGVVADSDFGPLTLRAVRAFQASHGLVVDGIVGPATRKALGLPAGPILRANRMYFPEHGKKHEDVRELQRRLGVVADGDFGPITLRAVRAFQARHGLVVDGIVGPATRRALGLPAGPILRAKRKYFPRSLVHHSAPRTTNGYVNPLAQASVTPERIDMGVDYAGTGTLTAMGDGRVTYAATSDTGWPGAFVEYQLMNGPEAGRYIYYAEGVRPAVSVGQVVRAGQAVAYLIPGWPSGIEIGWGSGIGTSTLAEEEGERAFPTEAGESFSALIASLGGPPGIP